MHELGIVYHIINRLEELAEEQNLTKISGVTLELGEVSGVLDDYLIDGWNWAVKKHDLLKDAELKIERLPAVTKCNSCNKEYETVKHGRICPFCKSENTVLVTGNEMSIKEIEAC